MNSSFSLMLFPSWRQPQQNIHLVQVFLEVPHLIQFCSDHDTHLANASGNKILLKGFKIWRTRYFRLSIFILQHSSSTLGVMNFTTATQAWNISTYQPTESSMLLKRSCNIQINNGQHSQTLQLQSHLKIPQSDFGNTRLPRCVKSVTTTWEGERKSETTVSSAAGQAELPLTLCTLFTAESTSLHSLSRWCQ